MSEGLVVRKLEDCALVEEAQPVVTALKKMSKYGLGLCVVVNKSGAICGVLTDGDIRRRVVALNEQLSHFFTRPVQDICNFDYICIKKSGRNGFKREEVIRLFKNNRIAALPVVNEDGALVGVVEAIDCLN